jgi:glycosyltransferase involved in cell wall biosynthesis
VDVINLTYCMDSGLRRWLGKSRVAATWKGIERRRILARIKWLVKRRQIDTFLLMKNNQSMFSTVRRIAEPAGVPMVYDLWVSRLLSAQRDGLLNSPQSQREKEIAAQSEWLLALTDPYRGFYSNICGYKKSKIIVAPLVVTDEWLTVPSVRRSSGPFVVAYWGSYLKQHGVEIALEAARLLLDEKGVVFRFYGDCASELVLASSGCILGNVELVQRIPDTTAFIKSIDGVDLSFGHLRLIHDAHLVLPNKAMEGMARGKPIVHVSSAELGPLYAGTGQGDESVCFFDGSPEALAAKIRFFRDQPGSAANVGALARRKLEQDHSIATLAAVFAEAIPRIRSNARR